MPSRKAAPGDLRFELRKMLAIGGAHLAVRHAWANENNRWLELVFAVLAASSTVPEIRLRNAVRILNYLGLAAPNVLASVDTKEESKAQVLEILIETGLSAQETHNALSTLSAIASTICREHQGKVQLFLRQHSSEMLDHMMDEIEAGREKLVLRQALTYWLQNTSSIPIPLADEFVRNHCDRKGWQIESLYEAADDFGVNVALVDDLVRGFEVDHLSRMARAAKKAPKEHPELEDHDA